VCLERYTRVLMKASLAFPIHFLKIYSISRSIHIATCQHLQLYVRPSNQASTPSQKYCTARLKSKLGIVHIYSALRIVLPQDGKEKGYLFVDGEGASKYEERRVYCGDHALRGYMPNRESGHRQR